MCSRWRGSIPLNGSSRSRIDGSWTSAAAILTRWRIPFEYVPTARSAAAARSTVAIARSVAAAGSGRRCSRAARSTNWRPVRNAWTASRSGTSPTCR